MGQKINRIKRVGQTANPFLINISMENQAPITVKEIEDFITKFKIHIKGLPLIAYLKMQEAINNEFEEVLKIVQDKTQNK